MTIEFKTSSKPVDYELAVADMEKRVAGIIADTEEEMVWLLEHPPLYTAGTSAKDSDLIDKKKFPVYKTGRGGEFTYHGPGQRVAYIMLDLKKRGMQDVKKYVWTLEEIIITTLAEYDIRGERRKGRIGIWVETENGEKKIAAIGIRIRKWVTYHGLAVNLNPDLSHFNGIVPCGIKEYGVTSFEELGIKPKDFDDRFTKKFQELFLIK